MKSLFRIFTPGIVTMLYYLLRFRARVSHRAEVDLSGNLVLGKGSTIGSFSKVKAFDGPLQIGHSAGIGNSCFLATGAAGIYIGDNFLCGANVNIVAVNYRHGDVSRTLLEQGSVSKGIRIGSNVWIGSGSTVTDGAQIGDNSIVAANSLVNRRYPPNSIIQGNPAKVIMKR